MVVGQLQHRVLAGEAHEHVDRLVADRHPPRAPRSRASRRTRPSGRCRRCGSRCGGRSPLARIYSAAARPARDALVELVVVARAGDPDLLGGLRIRSGRRGSPRPGSPDRCQAPARTATTRTRSRNRAARPRRCPGCRSSGARDPRRSPDPPRRPRSPPTHARPTAGTRCSDTDAPPATAHAPRTQQPHRYNAPKPCANARGRAGPRSSCAGCRRPRAALELERQVGAPGVGPHVDVDRVPAVLEPDERDRPVTWIARRDAERLVDPDVRVGPELERTDRGERLDVALHRGSNGVGDRLKLVLLKVARTAFVGIGHGRGRASGRARALSRLLLRGPAGGRGLAARPR